MIGVDEFPTLEELEKMNGKKTDKQIHPEKYHSYKNKQTGILLLPVLVFAVLCVILFPTMPEEWSNPGAWEVVLGCAVIIVGFIVYCISNNRELKKEREKQRQIQILKNYEKMNKKKK